MATSTSEQACARQSRPNRRNVMFRVAKAAEYLSVHPNTIRRWADDGIIRAYRIGPKMERRIRQEDLDEYLNRHIHPTATHHSA